MKQKQYFYIIECLKTEKLEIFYAIEHCTERAKNLYAIEECECVNVIEVLGELYVR